MTTSWLRSLVFPLVLAAIIVPSAGRVAGQDRRPDQWEARPPIHIRGNATTAPTGYAPAQIRTAYGFDQLPSATTGAGQVIAIVDAFDDPTVGSDLQYFINYFHLPQMYVSNCTVTAGPHPCLQKVYAQGSKPRTNGGWALEITLDVQWAHVIAPGADILLVEAASNSFSNLLGAVNYAVNARTAVPPANVTVVSMSWGGSEFSSEASYDSTFNKPGVTFVASSGDSGSGVIWPSASPYVLSVGGTSLKLTSANTISSETAWSGSGGGISAYESEPGYQSNYPIPNTGGLRGVPDVAYIANPSPGVSIYDTTAYQGQKGWFAVGGTSVGAPQWAALTALANQNRTSPLSTSSLSGSPFYTVGAVNSYATNYHDITSGNDGSCSICVATAGWDFVTGLGSPVANGIVPALSAY